MATLTRWPARELDEHEERVVRLRPGEDQDAALASAKSSITGQMARAIAKAPSDKLRRQLERRRVVAEKRGKRSIALRRLEDAPAKRQRRAEAAT